MTASNTEPGNDYTCKFCKKPIELDELTRLMMETLDVPRGAIVHQSCMSDIPKKTLSQRRGSTTHDRRNGA